MKHNKTIIFLCLFMCQFAFVKSQWIDIYAYARLGGGIFLKNEFNTHLDYYNSTNSTSVSKPRTAYGYKIGAGMTLQKFVFGMSQQVLYNGTQGKEGELPNGYRTWKNTYTARSGVVGYYTKKRNMINLEMGIAKSLIKTGFKYKDGFVSYGNESLTNGAYLGNSFIWGLEYIKNKTISENLFLSFSGAIHFSSPVSGMVYQDYMEYKRMGNNYVLYKSDNINPDVFPNPAQLSARYTMLSFQFGLYYKISQND